MKLKIITPEGVLFEGESDAVTFPGMAGSFDVIQQHEPLKNDLRVGLIL